MSHEMQRVRAVVEAMPMPAILFEGPEFHVGARSASAADDPSAMVERLRAGAASGRATGS